MAKQSKKRKTGCHEFPEKSPETLVGGANLLSRISSGWLGGLILFLAVVLVYQPVWFAGYLWDDDAHLTANPCIIGPLGLKEIWTTGYAAICPLTLTTFWLEHALWDLAPLPYHLVNVFLHGACAVVLWRVLRSLEVPGAWLGATLWALHPVQVESVAWISEMKNTESGLFFLLSILFFIRWLKTETNHAGSDADWSYPLTFLFAALAMASKSSTVVLPLVLGLCAWWVKGRCDGRCLARIAPIIFLSIVASAVSIWTQGQQLSTSNDPLAARSWPERLVTAGDAVWFYLGKLVWPYPLMTIYPRWQIHASEVSSYLPLLGVIGLLVILWCVRASWARPCFFAFAYFLVALLPVLGFADHYFLRFSFVADHFQYLASMGPLALAGAGMTRLVEIAMPGRLTLAGSLCAGLLLILGLLSRNRAWAYESQETLWADTLAKNPDCWLARNNLGTALSRKGKMDEAIEQFRQAVEIDPHLVSGYNNLGLALFQEGRVDEAMEQYQKALGIDAHSAEAHYDLGLAYAKKGRLDEAIEQYQKALEIKPDYAQAHNNLGNAFLQKGRLQEAIAEYEKTLEIDPTLAAVDNNLGNALFRNGQVNEAIAQFEKALEIDPGLADVHNNLGVALSHQGKLDEAVGQFQAAIEINPSYADAQHNLARAQELIERKKIP